MSDLTVQHYLGIYETRLSMSERGITHPAPTVIDGVKRLVLALRELSPDEKVHVHASDAQAIFTRAATGALIARIDFQELE